ncbi:MAG: pantetheine-phosphate adenylyltransferase [Candidatus Roizmanbacteria bacterium]
MKYKVALLIGRFQPFHKGHLYLVKKTLEKADKLVFGIGSTSIYDENNPLDYETRRKIIKAVAYKEKIEDRVIKIIPLEDFFNDKKWLNNVKKQVGDFDLVVGNNEWTNKIMEKAGYHVKRFPYYKRYLYEGWRIRKLSKEGKKWEERVPDYLISNFELLISKFSHVVIGGTFDHFHKGHQALINKAFGIGKKVTVGIAQEKLYRNKLLSKTVESYTTRKKNLLTYIHNNFGHDRVKTRPFSEFTGGADKNRNIDAIVVSRFSYSNALKINQLRKKNNLPLLRIIIIKDVLADDGKILSSERIRVGEINREGKVYDLRFKNKKQLIMPEYLREELRKPLGKVFNDTNSLLHYINIMEWTMVIAVGDIIVDSLLKEGIEPDIKIIDFRSRRKPLKMTGPVLLRAAGIPKRSTPVVNKPGTINLKTAEKLKQLIQKNEGWLVIDGEEDLLALPSILFAPLDSLVLYGHWHYGVIGVKVTENTKEMAKSVLNQFKIS